MTPRRTTCDGPGCENAFDMTTGMDHWFEATEFDTDSMEERQYCSRECLVSDQRRLSEQSAGPPSEMSGETVEQVLAEFGNEHEAIRAVRLWMDGKMGRPVPGYIKGVLEDTDGRVCFQWVDNGTGYDGYIYHDGDEMVYTFSDGRDEFSGKDARERLEDDLGDSEFKLSPLLKENMPDDGAVAGDSGGKT